MIDFYFFRFRVPDITPLRLYFWHIRYLNSCLSGNAEAQREASTRIIQLGGRV